MIDTKEGDVQMKTLNEDQFEVGLRDGQEDAIVYALKQKKDRGTMGTMPEPNSLHTDCAKHNYDMGYFYGFNDVQKRLNPYLQRKLQVKEVKFALGDTGIGVTGEFTSAVIAKNLMDLIDEIFEGAGQTPSECHSSWYKARVLEAIYLGKLVVPMTVAAVK